MAVVFVTLLVLVILDRSGSGGDDASPLAVVPARPSEITAIRSVRDGLAVELERGSDAWTVRSGTMHWPADDRRVSAGLRLLASAIARTSDAPPPAVETSCTIEFGTGSETLLLGARSLSGLRNGVLRDRGVRVDDALADMLQPESLLTWSDTSAMPGIGAEVRSIRVEAGDDTFELARVGTRWGLTQPIQTPADPGQVAALIGALASLRMTTTTETGVPGAPGLEVFVESNDTNWRLICDAEGLGKSQRERGGQTLSTPMRLDASSLNSLGIDPAALIAQNVLDVPASDIERLSIGNPGVILDRDGRGWSASGAEAEALLDLLTSVPADSIIIEPAPNGSPIVLTRFGGLPVPEMVYVVHENGLAISDGQVTRTFGRSNPRTDEVALWLSGLGG